MFKHPGLGLPPFSNGEFDTSTDNRHFIAENGDLMCDLSAVGEPVRLVEKSYRGPPAWRCGCGDAAETTAPDGTLSCGAEICMGDGPQVAAFMALSSAVLLLTAPHQNHTGMDCYGGRSDCCWRCATMEGLVYGVREMNSLMRDSGRQIAMPEWCGKVHAVDVIAQPAAQYRHEYCQVCGHRDPKLPALAIDESMRRYYTADMIENITLDSAPALAAFRKKP